MKGKTLLVINESREANLKLKLYTSRDLVCYIPLTSKEIKPNEKFSHTSQRSWKLELVAMFNDRKQPKKVLLKPHQWVGKRYVRITESLDVIEDDLSNYPEEEKYCLRKENRDQDLESTGGQRNFYSILRLNMADVRAMSKDEQDKEIARAFLRELQIWHPDHNERDGDYEIVRELIMAFAILIDREKRARYNNFADYDSGWLLGKRFKAVFWPECETVAQRLAWIKRMGLLALSATLTIGGIVGVVLTAGFSSPLLVSVVSGGLNSLLTTMSMEAVLDGCGDVGRWLMSTGAGCLLAALPGGAAIGVSLLQSTALSVSEFIGIRVAIAAGCAVVSSLGSDAKKGLLDGSKVTPKQALVHASCQCAAAIAGTLAGVAVAKAMHIGSQTTAAASNLEEAVGEIAENLEGAVEEIGEQAPSLTDQATCFLKKIPVPLATTVTKTVIDRAGEFAAAELLGDTEKVPENNTFLPYLPYEILIEKAIECAEKFVLDDSTETLSAEEGNVDGSEVSQVGSDTHVTEKLRSGNITCISNGWWYSGLTKMIVSYQLNGKEITKKVRGQRKQIKIPRNAKKIKVRFKIWRPPWGNIVKYDRFKRCWCEPCEAHVFHYPTPVFRTFTIEGTLWWEAVMKVTDEHHDEKDDI